MNVGVPLNPIHTHRDAVVDTPASRFLMKLGTAALGFGDADMLVDSGNAYTAVVLKTTSE